MTIPFLSDTSAQLGMLHALPLLVFGVFHPSPLSECLTQDKLDTGTEALVPPCPGSKRTLEKKARVLCLCFQGGAAWMGGIPGSGKPGGSSCLPSPFEHFRFSTRKQFLVFSNAKV